MTKSPGGEVNSGQAAVLNWQRVFILALVLPLFAQTFHYIKDLPPLWALSKAFPVLSFPFAAALLMRRQEIDPTLWLGSFAWLVMVSSLVSVFTFEQSFFVGLTSQVKLLGMLHVLSFLGLLLWMRPTLLELAYAFSFWAIITIAVVILLGVFAPQEWYTTEYNFGDAPLLSVDDRGNRIRMPMFFGLIGMFILFRKFVTKRDIRAFLLVIMIFGLLVFLVKTRALIFGAMGALILVTFFTAGFRIRIAVFGFVMVGLIGLSQIPFITNILDEGTGTGLGVRLVTINRAIDFLGDNPLLWLLGAGTISPLEPDGLARFFNHFFFLADIAWTGILFEFGAIGVGLLLGLLLRTWWLGKGLGQHINAPFLGGLQDYVLMVLAMSPLYPTITLQPGEIAVIAAILLYARMLLNQDIPENVRRQL